MRGARDRSRGGHPQRGAPRRTASVRRRRKERGRPPQARDRAPLWNGHRTGVAFSAALPSFDVNLEADRPAGVLRDERRLVRGELLREALERDPARGLAALAAGAQEIGEHLPPVAPARRRRLSGGAACAAAWRSSAGAASGSSAAGGGGTIAAGARRRAGSGAGGAGRMARLLARSAPGAPTAGSGGRGGNSNADGSASAGRAARAKRSSAGGASGAAVIAERRASWRG